jgi:hypothetical protein
MVDLGRLGNNLLAVLIVAIFFYLIYSKMKGGVRMKIPFMKDR